MLAEDSASVHTSHRTINWPMTGGVHLFAGRVMGLSLVDNSARAHVCAHAHAHAHTKRNPGLNHSCKHMVDTGRQLEQQRLCTPSFTPRPPTLSLRQPFLFTSSPIMHAYTERISLHGFPQPALTARVPNPLQLCLNICMHINHVDLQ